MRTVFRRQLIGYKPAEVKETLNEELSQYVKQLEEYESQLVQILNENKNLREQIKVLESDMFDYNNLKSQLEKLLFDTHVEACKNVLQVEEKFDDMIAYKAKIITDQVNKNKNIKESINNLLSRIQTIVEE